MSQEAGATRKALYCHYPSKDALINAAPALRHTQLMAKMRLFVDAAATERRPLAYIGFIANRVQENDSHGCAFINATAEFARPDAPPHQQAAKHKQGMQTYLQELCAIAGAAQSEPVSTRLFLIGEGLIVASQVQGHDASLVEAARAIARVSWFAAK